MHGCQIGGPKTFLLMSNGTWQVPFISVMDAPLFSVAALWRLKHSARTATLHARQPLLYATEAA
jgi:hypothetical protein